MNFLHKGPDNISSFVGPMISAATTQLCPQSTNTATDKWGENECVKHSLQEQTLTVKHLQEQATATRAHRLQSANAHLQSFPLMLPAGII